MPPLRHPGLHLASTAMWQRDDAAPACGTSPTPPLECAVDTVLCMVHRHSYSLRRSLLLGSSAWQLNALLLYVQVSRVHLAEKTQ